MKIESILDTAFLWWMVSWVIAAAWAMFLSESREIPDGKSVGETAYGLERILWWYIFGTAALFLGLPVLCIPFILILSFFH